MNSSSQIVKPKQLHTPGWHEEARTPVVDGKYENPTTGQVLIADCAQYLGPPAVDIIILSIHGDTAGCVFRAARAFKMEHLLANVVRVTSEKELDIDSLNASPYAIRVVLAHELTKDDFTGIALEMVNGLFANDI